MPVTTSTDAVTLVEAKRHLNVTTDVHDEEIGYYIAAATAAVEAEYGLIVQRTVTDEEHAGGGHVLFLRQWPVASITSVTEYSSGTSQALAAETATVSTSYDYRFDAGLGVVARRASWSDTTFGASWVRVTYVAGRYATTAAVTGKWKLAVKTTLRQLWRPDQSVGTDTFGALPTPGGDIPTFTLPRAVHGMLLGERRPAAIG
jgi:uncharacterized phiE125 gp8 family phage protein